MGTTGAALAPASRHRSSRRRASSDRGRHPVDHADGFGVARASRTVRTLANGGQSLSALAQRGTVGSHPAGLATSRGAHHFLCLSLLSVAVVLKNRSNAHRAASTPTTPST